jgi:hypothetical protein
MGFRGIEGENHSIPPPCRGICQNWAGGGKVGQGGKRGWGGRGLMREINWGVMMMVWENGSLHVELKE